MKSISNLNEILGKEFKVLDKGFIRLIDYMGSDESIVQSARVSYGQGTKEINQDEGLIRYLLRHRHTTPFEMCEIKFHIKAPIFIARQWMRHRTANINEISGRYSVLKNEYFLPDIDQICKQSKGNKQGRAEIVDEKNAQEILDKMDKLCKNSFDEYNNFINNHNLTRELARIIMPLGVYTEFYWKIDLHNLLHFLHLRSGPGAQKEIRDYAEIMLEIVKSWVPFTYKAFMDFRKNSIDLSALEIEKISNLLDKSKVEEFLKNNHNTKGEEKEFYEKLKKLLP